METVAKNYPVFEDVELSKLPILPTINIRAILGGDLEVGIDSTTSSVRDILWLVHHLLCEVGDI